MYLAHTALQIQLSLHNKEVQGYVLTHVFPMAVWVLSHYFGFLPESKTMQVKFTGMFKLPLSVNVVVTLALNVLHTVQ